MGGNIERFGKVEDAYYKQGLDGQWRLYGTGGIILTGFPIQLLGTVTREDIIRINTSGEKGDPLLSFGKYKGRRISEVPMSYRIWMLEKMRNTIWPEEQDALWRSIQNNVRDTRGDPPAITIPDGRYAGKLIKETPLGYLRWYYGSKQWNETNDSLKRGLEMYLRIQN